MRALHGVAMSSPLPSTPNYRHLRFPSRGLPRLSFSFASSLGFESRSLSLLLLFLLFSLLLEDGSYLRGTRSTLHRRDPVADPHPGVSIWSPLCHANTMPPPHHPRSRPHRARSSHWAGKGGQRQPHFLDGGWRNLRLRHGVHLRTPFCSGDG